MIPAAYGWLLTRPHALGCLDPLLTKTNQLDLASSSRARHAIWLGGLEFGSDRCIQKRVACILNPIGTVIGAF